jgi:hypothetical protein
MIFLFNDTQLYPRTAGSVYAILKRAQIKTSAFHVRPFSLWEKVGMRAALWESMASLIPPFYPHPSLPPAREKRKTAAPE